MLTQNYIETYFESHAVAVFCVFCTFFIHFSHFVNKIFYRFTQDPRKHEKEKVFFGIIYGVLTAAERLA